MAIGIRSELTGGTTTSGADGTFAVTKPSSVSDGDYLVVIIGKQDDPNVAAPADWTVGSQGGSASGNDKWGGIYYRKITGSSGEPASYTFDSEGTNESVGWWIGSLSGIDQTTPQDVAFGSWAALANDTSPNAPAVTVVTNGAMAFACWAVNTSSGTMPGGDWNTRASNVGGNRVLYVASQIFASSGTSTLTPEISLFSSGMETMVGMFVFRPMADKTATFSKTLDSATLNGSGKLANEADLSKTLDDVTKSFIGTNADNVSLSKILDGITLSSAGTVESPVEQNSAALSSTLDNASSTLDGDVADYINLDKTLDNVTFTLSGTITNNAILNKTLEDLSKTLDGKVDVVASLSKTLDGISSSLVSTSAISEALSKILDSITTDLDGTVADKINSNIVLENATSSGYATFQVIAELSKTLGDATLNSEGTVGASTNSAALSKNLDAITTSLDGVVAITATSGIVFENATLNSNGTVGAATNSAILDKNLDAITTSLNGVVAITVTSGIVFEDSTLSSDGTVQTPGATNEAELSKILDDAGLSSTGANHIYVNLDKTLDDLTFTSTLSSAIFAALIVTLSNISATISGDIESVLTPSYEEKFIVKEENRTNIIKSEDRVLRISETRTNLVE